MELNHLKYFYFVAREGGYSKASRSLRVAQPAVSKMVKNLESALGRALFERVGREVRLTKFGNDVYRKCELIFANVEEIRQLARARSGKVEGPLTLAAADVIASHVVPGVLKRLLARHPGVFPQVFACTANDALRNLVAGGAEFTLLFHAPPLPEGIELRKAIPVAFKLVVAESRKRSPAVCASFIGSREVDDVSNSAYPTLSKLRKKHPAAEIKISSNSLDAHRKLVLEGMGVSILPAFLVAEDIKERRLACLLEEEEFVFNLKVAVPAGRPLSAAAAAFLEDLEKVLDAFCLTGDALE